MGGVLQPRWSESEIEAIREGLIRVVNSRPFEQSIRRQRFLKYVVTEAIEGRADKLKGYSIGIEVFDKPAAFDPLTDPVVRVEASRLRDKLREYYDTDGHGDPVRIVLPKGTYEPRIEVLSTVAPGPVQFSSGPRSDENATGVRRPGHLWSAGVVASALAILLAGWTLSRPPDPLSTNLDNLSLAVMPFETIGGDPSWRRLADGMTQDITTDLSQSKDLLVVARNSTEIYRGKGDVRTVGRELGVRYLLQGSVQPEDTRIRVTAQLIDARSGNFVWSARYNRPTADLFEVQSAVTESIASTLTGYEGAMAQAERALIRRKPPTVLTAYENYLLGMEAKHGGASGGVSEKGLQEAERFFRKALDIDPQFARAYVGLCYVYEYRLDLNIGVAPENVAHLVEAANTAVRLDPNDGEAHMVLGHAFVYQGLADKALKQFSKAEALAPSNADLLILIAWYLPQLDQTERAVALAERALRLNPNYPAWYNQGFRYVYFFSGAFDKVVKFVKLVPNPNPLDFAFLAMASAMLDDPGAAHGAAAELHQRDASWNVETYLSDNGGVPDKLVHLFIQAAGKAGIQACERADKIAANPAFVHVPACDEMRTKKAALP